MPLSRAHATSLAQFRSLRSEQEVAHTIATLEAEHYGAEFLLTETERGFNKELEAVKTWHVDERHDQIAIAAKNDGRLLLSVTSLLFLGRLVRSMPGFGKKGFVRITLLR